MTELKNYDAVVIGSGLGGLRRARCLRKTGYSVCLLERNFSLGGAASVYGRRAHCRSLASSDLRRAQSARRETSYICAELGILDEIEWLPTGPLYTVRGGPVGEAFALPFGFDAAHDALASRFPDKSHAIRRFLNDVERIHDSLWTLKQAREEHSLAKLTRALWEIAPAAANWQNRRSLRSSTTNSAIAKR